MTTTYSPIQFPVGAPRRSLKTRHSQRKRHATAVPTARAAMTPGGDEWTRLHFCLGVCDVSAQRWFESASATLRERYQLALTRQVASGDVGEYSLLHDPLEDDPQWAEAFAEVEETLAFELELAEVEDGPNFCLLVWSEKARLLREEFGLEWFSPAQMNPFVRFA